MPTPTTDRAPLRADCSRCSGLCCVALPFARSADFPVDKAAGEPCRHLGAPPGGDGGERGERGERGDRGRREDPAGSAHGCGIHPRLLAEGWAGCVAFDCFGAGQVVTQHTVAGTDWRRSPQRRGEVFAAFDVVRVLHELLWYLAEVLDLAAASPLHDEVHPLRERVAHLARADGPTLAALDLAALRGGVGEVLGRASELVRAGAPSRRGRRGHGGQLAPRRDLVGARLAGADLRGASLRGALLVGADLRGADLRLTDLLGADLRGADLRGADASTALFATRSQVGAARGDRATRLPGALEHPAHWLPAGR